MDPTNPHFPKGLIINRLVACVMYKQPATLRAIVRVHGEEYLNIQRLECDVAYHRRGRVLVIRDHCSVMQWAAVNGSKRMMRAILHMKGNPNIVSTSEKCDVLTLAVCAANDRAVEALLEAGVPPISDAQVSLHPQTGILTPCTGRRNQAILAALNFTKCDKADMILALLFKACTKINVDLAYLEYSDSVLYLPLEHPPLLRKLAELGYNRAFKVLMSSGPNVIPPNPSLGPNGDRDTVMHYALLNLDEEACGMLIKAGAPMFASNIHGIMPVHMLNWRPPLAHSPSMLSLESKGRLLALFRDINRNFHNAVIGLDRWASNPQAYPAVTPLTPLARHGLFTTDDSMDVPSVYVFRGWNKLPVEIIRIIISHVIGPEFHPIMLLTRLWHYKMLSPDSRHNNVVERMRLIS